MFFIYLKENSEILINLSGIGRQIHFIFVNQCQLVYTPNIQEPTRIRPEPGTLILQRKRSTTKLPLPLNLYFYVSNCFYKRISTTLIKYYFSNCYIVFFSVRCGPLRHHSMRLQRKLLFTGWCRFNDVYPGYFLDCNFVLFFVYPGYFFNYSFVSFFGQV